MVNLDDPPVDVEPVQIDPPHPLVKNLSKPSPSKPSDRPSNLVLDENYAWRTFKGIITDHEVNECYNMSVREFERFGIHDLFKVVFRSSLCAFKIFFFFFLNNTLNFHSSMHRLCQNFT